MNRQLSINAAFFYLIPASLAGMMLYLGHVEMALYVLMHVCFVSSLMLLFAAREDRD